MEFRRDDDYISHLYNTYKVLYADFDDSGLPEEGIPEYNASQKVILAFILFIFNVFLLNMLISIMGNAFDEVQQGRILIDSLTKVNMIIENQSLMQKLTKKPSKKGYLMVCERGRMVKEKEELEFKIEKQIKSEFEQMRQENKEQIKSEFEQMRQENKEAKKQIKSEFEQMRKELTEAFTKKN